MTRNSSGFSALTARVEEWVVDKSTRLFARLTRSRIEGTATYTPSDRDPIEIYRFTEDSAFLGQTTPVDTILLNTKYLDKLSEQAVELIIQHELGHSDRNAIVRGIFWGLVFNGAAGIASLLMTGLTVTLGNTPAALVQTVLVSSSGTLLFLVANRLEETWADLHALRVLGEDDFLEGYEEISEVADGGNSLPARIWTAVAYTDPVNVVRVNNSLAWLNKQF